MSNPSDQDSRRDSNGDQPPPQPFGQACGNDDSRLGPPEVLIEVVALATQLPLEQRDAYVRTALGYEPKLLAEALSLVKAASEAGGFLRGQKSAHESASTDPVPKLAPGSRINRYLLDKRIGEGGFGEVYRAIQEHPVQREVALKVIKSGMNSRAIVERFEQERRALARMDHPNIAALYDAGETDSGEPYFVMELVHGEAITAFAARKSLSIRARIQLVIEVARAVQHAHQRGVIHRDLKPSNILVHDRDGIPVPKVIDFGIAKAIAGEQAPGLVTQAALFVGTPAYVAPEQLPWNVGVVDVRTDVYTLGVVLHELLTGRTLGGLSGQGDRSSGGAIQSITPDVRRGPARSVRGELSWIIARATAEQAQSRYAGAGEFADDLERWLRDEPVEAAPESAMYSLRKLVQRHVLATLFGVIACCAILIGVVGTTAGWVAATRREAEAHAERDRAVAAELSASQQFRAARIAKDEMAVARSAAEFDAYLAGIMGAAAALDAGEPGRAREMLEQCPPGQRHWEWRYLSARLDTSVMQFLGHGDQVRDVVLSPDESMVATCGLDRTARVYDVSTGRLLALLKGHRGAVERVRFSCDGGSVVTAGRDGVAIIWDLGTALPLHVLRGHSAPLNTVELSPDGRHVVTSSVDGTCRVWDVHTGKFEFSLLGHEQEVRQAVYSPDGLRILTCSHDHTVRLFDAMTGSSIRTLGRHDGIVETALFSPTGTYVASASADGTAMVWDSDNGLLAAVLKGHTDTVYDVRFSADSSKLVTASRDTTARVWDRTSGSCLAVLRGHADVVRRAAFHPGGHLVVTGSTDSTLRLWTNSGEEIQRLCAHQAGVQHLCFDNVGKHLLSASSDGTARVWRLDDAAEPRVLRGHTDDVRDGVFSSTGHAVFTGSYDRTVRHWDLRTFLSKPFTGIRGLYSGIALKLDEASGRVFSVGGSEGYMWDLSRPDSPLSLCAHRDKVYAAEPSPDGATVLTCGRDGRVVVSDAETGRVMFELCEHNSRVPAAHFSPDGTAIVTASYDRTVRLWHARTDKSFASAAVALTDAPQSRCMFSPSGDLVATADIRGCVYVWNGRDLSPVWKLPLHARDVTCLSFSRDGRLLASCSEDGCVGVFDAYSGRVVSVLRRHSGTVEMAEFSVDNERLVSACHDGTCRVWHTRSGRELLVLRGHTRQVFFARWSPDQSMIVSGSRDRTVRVWDSRSRRDRWLSSDSSAQTFAAPAGQSASH